MDNCRATATSRDLVHWFAWQDFGFFVSYRGIVPVPSIGELPVGVSIHTLVSISQILILRLFQCLV